MNELPILQEPLFWLGMLNLIVLVVLYEQVTKTRNDLRLELHEIRNLVQKEDTGPKDLDELHDQAMEEQRVWKAKGYPLTPDEIEVWKRNKLPLPPQFVQDKSTLHEMWNDWEDKDIN